MQRASPDVSERCLSVELGGRDVGEEGDVEKLQSDSFKLQALTCSTAGAPDTESTLVVDGSQSATAPELRLSLPYTNTQPYTAQDLPFRQWCFNYSTTFSLSIPLSLTLSLSLSLTHTHTHTP